MGNLAAGNLIPKDDKEPGEPLKLAYSLHACYPDFVRSGKISIEAFSWIAASSALVEVQA